jgi:protocatechuate 3,4-dioxygenase beta subunit
MTRTAQVLSALAIGIAFSQGAFAQEDKKSKKEEAALRSVQGTVVDADDKPVVGAVVQLKDVRNLQMRSYITKANGEYHFSTLKIDDDYEVEARNKNMTSGPKKISIFDNRKVVIQNLKADKPEKKQ